MQNTCAIAAISLLSLFVETARAQPESPVGTGDAELSEITVRANRIANDTPASSYAAVATALRFDPLTELQSRGIAEGQSDVTVRGGLFENTGFKVGAVSIMDPQTGHYVAELPLDPAFLSSPSVHTGIQAAVEGFNSSIATVSYGINKVGDAGYISYGRGSDSLNFQTVRVSRSTTNSQGNDTGMAVSLAHSEGDGSVQFGDHKFSRANLQLQHSTPSTQSDLLVSYQDKFYGWPGAYTGFATLPETDETQTTLLLGNHRRSTTTGWFEAGAFYRRLVDDYDFDRTTSESGGPGSFDHETRVFGLGFQGLQQQGALSWRYGGQLTSDDLVRSTDLTNGEFSDRMYATLTVLPSLDMTLTSGALLQWRAGLTFDYSDRDSSATSPLLGVSLIRNDASGSTEYSIEYAATSQLPGYTALKSNPAGLFGGNPGLGREKAKQLSASLSRDTGDWQFSATLFSRRDDNLVDWTYATAAPFTRQANPVDIDVSGLETYFVRRWEAIDMSLGLAVLDKDADYGSAPVDASFYALNFARQRATLAIVYRFATTFELRVDSEYRRQETNPLRVGDDSTLLASASLVWSAPGQRRLGGALVVDNATDSEYQPFPGTPASGRQFSLSLHYAW